MAGFGWCLAVGAALLMAAPMVVGQGAPDPYEGCASDPAWCDPVAANDGTVKAGDEPVRVILYAHFQDLLQRAPLTTQPPDPQREPDVQRGFLMPSLYVKDGAGLPCCQLFQSNRFLMFSSPGPVEYTEDGAWRVWSTTALAEDLRLSGDTMTGFFYLSPGDNTGPGTDAGIMPAVGVRMTMQIGGGLPTESSPVVASGDSGANADGGAPVTMVSEPGQDPVYELRVPMQIHIDTLPAVPDTSQPGERAGFLVEAVVYQVETDQAVFTQSQWHLRTGHQWPPRVVMDVHEPLVGQPLRFVGAGNGMVVAQWDVAGVLGSYDVDPDSFKLEIRGPTPIGAQLSSVRDLRLIEHAGELKPVMATWELGSDQRLADGTYVAMASVENQQGTYRAEKNTTFEVRGGAIQLESRTPLAGESVLPGPGLPGLLAAAASALAVAALRRRRRTGGT
jgi:hypothetical protein